VDFTRKHRIHTHTDLNTPPRQPHPLTEYPHFNEFKASGRYNHTPTRPKAFKGVSAIFARCLLRSLQTVFSGFFGQQQLIPIQMLPLL